MSETNSQGGATTTGTTQGDVTQTGTDGRASTIVTNQSPPPPPASPPPPPVSPPPPPPAATATPDWRERYAKGDAAKLEQLKRYTDEDAFINSTWELRTKIRQPVATKPPENATPEQMTTWRKDNGIPETPDGYLQGLPDGMVIGDDDKARFTNFAERMHKANVPPSAVHEAVKWYFDLAENVQAEQRQLDDRGRAESEDQMREVWGQDYRTNVNLLSGLFDGELAPISEILFSARLPDGRQLMQNREALKFFGDLARERVRPDYVPGGGASSQGKDIDARITEIEEMMRPSSKNYGKYQRDPKIQQEYRELVDLKSRRGARAA